MSLTQALKDKVAKKSLANVLDKGFSRTKQFKNCQQMSLIQALEDKYDPTQLFERLKKIPFQHTDSQYKAVMRQFIIDELYETMGKLRNAWFRKNIGYLPQVAFDFAWETAVLIGLANKSYYQTRATTLQEAVKKVSHPEHYDQLVALLLQGNLADKEQIYLLCEDVWNSIHQWIQQFDIEYIEANLPFD